MTQEQAHKEKPFEPEDYPALREFFPAYLHQDFSDEYGSAAGAVQVFLSEASGDEILQVKDEWALFRKELQKLPLTEIQKAIRKLGGAWVPENESELAQFNEILHSTGT